jgi:catechol 2,3-dioxygenase-like lactoylglutathione lyase family enzyme
LKGTLKEVTQKFVKTRKETFTMTTMQMKLELVAVPVTDVDRAKAFYTEKIGFHADFDQQVHEQLRFVQLTPPGSACSIVMGVGITNMQPGSVDFLLMVVQDVKAVREELANRGVEISELDAQDWGTFAYFRDPDGNRWSLQQLPHRG